MQIEVVPIRWSRSPVASILKASFALCEDPEVGPKMGVSMKHVSLEQIPIVILRPASPKIVVVVLVAFTNLTAERQIPISTGIERDEFDRVEKLRTARWVAQI